MNQHTCLRAKRWHYIPPSVRVPFQMLGLLASASALNEEEEDLEEVAVATGEARRVVLEKPRERSDEATKDGARNLLDNISCC